MRVVGWALAGAILVAAIARAADENQGRGKPEPSRRAAPGTPATRGQPPVGQAAPRGAQPGSPAYRPGGPAMAPRSPAPGAGAARFPDRVRSGQLESLNRGEVAQKVQLSQQYRMADKGDVARRMNLYQNARHPYAVYNNVHSPDFRRRVDIGYFPYHGVVSVSFGVGSFHGYYAGPGFYPQYVYYPPWSPWVSWSWDYRPNPYWDPRPIWCQPVYYEPAPMWVYAPTPVFVAMPVTSCGTWVDVPPAYVPPLRYDVQLLAVRFVDPGHPEEHRGPRYRVWFRNNGSEPITQGFNVVALASNDPQLQPGLPQAGVRVRAIAAGDTQSVDIRLPVEVNGMGRAPDGSPIPFSNLHVLVDANREVPDINPANNGAQLAREEILPIDPASFEIDTKSSAATGALIIAGEGFGPQPGQVIVHLGGTEMQAEITGWYDLGVQFKMPTLPLSSPAQAELVVVRGDGAAANPLPMTVMPPPPATGAAYPPGSPAGAGYPPAPAAGPGYGPSPAAGYPPAAGPNYAPTPAPGPGYAPTPAAGYPPAPAAGPGYAPAPAPGPSYAPTPATGPVFPQPTQPPALQQVPQQPQIQ